ncbi:MAG TPA: TIGR03667 family PPOX class F420-dependent oxidoreductase [Ktedonobacterales bacterium]
MPSILPDPATKFGARVAERLRDARVIWLTTMGADGTPQPNPVWFIWEDDTFLIYSLPDAHRVAHIRANPRVALHFDGNGKGGDIIVFTGTARLAADAIPSPQHAAYQAKYGEVIAREFHSPEQFAAEYSLALRVTPGKVRGF